MDMMLSRGPRGGPLGLLAGAYAVLFGLSRLFADAPLRRLMAIPFAITAVLYGAAVVGLVMFGDDLLGLLWGRPESVWLQIVWWASAVLLIGVGLLALILLFTTVAEAVGGPFFDQMAVRVLDRHGVPTREPGMFEGLVPDLLRSLAFPVGVVVFGLLGFIPVVGVAFVVLGTGVAWLGFASAAVNPALAVTGYSVGARLQWLRTHLATSLGIGGMVAAAMLIPLAGLLAIPASIVGAAELHARDPRRADRLPDPGPAGRP